MGRRQFVLFGGATVVWPLAGRAQQPDRLHRIGVLVARVESNPEGKAWVTAFREELQKFGWTEGRNVRIDTH